MDRSIGALRRGLRELGIADNTLVIFCSDNGGLPEVAPGTVGELRGFKNSVFEGGLRVPAIIEWPAMIKRPRITQYPACTMDIFPTIAELVGLPKDAQLAPVDGSSLVPVLTSEMTSRVKPIPFRHLGRAALVDNHYKILTQKIPDGPFELYDLEADPKESTNIATEKPEIAARLRTALLQWNTSVEASAAGKDYPEGTVSSKEPTFRLWKGEPIYQPYLEAWKNRPEFSTPGAN
jgi:arylsulfatase A-like enzyme